MGKKIAVAFDLDAAAMFVSALAPAVESMPLHVQAIYIPIMEAVEKNIDDVSSFDDSEWNVGGGII